MTKPTSNVITYPQTPGSKVATGEGSGDGPGDTSEGKHPHITPSFSFGLGFPPSFLFNSPRNLNLLNAWSPQRILQVSNNLNRAIHSRKDVFTTPSKSRFEPVADHASDGSPHGSHGSHTSHSPVQESSNDSSGWNLDTSLTTYESPSRDKDQEFLTPNRLFLRKPASASRQSGGRKRRLSIEASPNTSLASKVESINSPLSTASLTRRSSTSSLDDKLWSDNLDASLASSYSKFKAFKEANNAETILKNVSQNKVLSRMLLNKTGILRTPKQIASRLIKLNSYGTSQAAKYRKLDESPSLNDEIDEIIRTPLEDLISSASTVDTINSTEINSQIDKELDLIFSPNLEEFLEAKLEISDFQISYSSESNLHQFVKYGSKLNTPAKLSTYSLLNRLKMAHSKENLAIIRKFESGDAFVYQVSNHFNLNMVANKKFDSLSSVIENRNPLDLEKGSINSFMKLAIDKKDSESILNWNCQSKVYNGADSLFTHTDKVMGYFNVANQRFDLTLPFLKNFWVGFLSLLINGHDDYDMIKQLSVVQVLSDDSENIHAIFIHKFDKFNNRGLANFQLIKYSGSSDELNELEEEAEDEVHLLSQAPTEEDDNETVLANSSPIQRESPRKDLRIDPSLANRNFGSGPATAPIYNPKLVQQMNKGVVKQDQTYSQHSHLANDMSTYSGTTPSLTSPFNTYNDGSKSSSFAATPASAGLVTSTPAKNGTFNSLSKAQQLASQAPTPVPQATQVTSSQPVMMTFGNPYMAQPPQVDLQQMAYLEQQRIAITPNKGTYMNNDMINMNNQMNNQMNNMNNSMNSNINNGVNNMVMNNLPMNPALMNMANINPNMNLAFNPQLGMPLNMNNMNMNYMHPPTSAPASQTAFNVYGKAGNNKENQRPIKFGPMLEYDPSKDNAAAAANTSRMRGRRSGKPGVSVINMPVGTDVHMYMPPKKK